MNRINRTILSIMGVSLLILSYGLSCRADCVAVGPASCSIFQNGNFVVVTADATPPGDPNAQSSAYASAGVSDTLTFFGTGQHAFVEFEFFEILFAGDGGSASVSFNNGSLTFDQISGTADSALIPITFGVPFSFNVSAVASEDVSGALDGHDQLSEAGFELTDILVVNAGGHPLRNIHLTSGSGTVYPLDAANTLPSPEPSSLSLLGFGLIALLLAASRKRFGLQL